MADFTPKAHLLESHTSNNMPWWQALAELIDNALDANAKRVSIEVAGRSLIIRDDGNGVEDVLSLFRLGEHKKSKSTKLGRYGVGAKDAWLSCSDVMKVTSVRNGIKTSLQVDYKSLITNNWQGDDPQSEPTELPSGTTLEFKLRSGTRPPHKEAIDKVAWAFTPAIKNGIQILYGKPSQREVVKPCEIPDLQDVVESSFDIDGKSVHIRIGILPNGTTMPRGPFWLAHGHRIITPTSIGSKPGCGEKIGGIITLGDGWKLSRHKDDLTENKDRLEQEIATRIEHITQKASSIAQTIEIAGLRTQIQMLIDTVIDNVKEKRGKGNSSGSAGPTNSGRKRKNATKIDENDEGSVEVSGTKGRAKKVSGIDFDWQSLGDVSLGVVDPLSSRVSLNIDNAFVRELRDQGNAVANLLCVCSLIADYESRHAGSQKLLSFKYEDFSLAVGQLLDKAKGITDVKASV
jgi:hypothetical protein